MKKVTMELGGHAPAIVCEDANLDVALKFLSRIPKCRPSVGIANKIFNTRKSL